MRPGDGIGAEMEGVTQPVFPFEQAPPGSDLSSTITSLPRFFSE